MASTPPPPPPQRAMPPPSPPPPPEPLTLNLVLNSSAASGTTLGDVLGAYDDVIHSACFRKALAWGGGVAGALVAHSVRGGKPWRRAFNAAFLGFLVTFYAQWWACKEDEYYQRLSLRQKLAERQRAAFATPVPPTAADAAPGAREHAAVPPPQHQLR